MKTKLKRFDLRIGYTHALNSNQQWPTFFDFITRQRCYLRYVVLLLERDNSNANTNIVSNIERTLSPLRIGGEIAMISWEEDAEENRRPAFAQPAFDPRFSVPAWFRHFITIFDHAKANISMNRQIPEERGRFLSASRRFCTAVCVPVSALTMAFPPAVSACFVRELVDIRV